MIAKFESPDAKFKVKMGFNVTKYLILATMTEEYPKPMTASEIHRRIAEDGGYDVSINSIRNALTRMTTTYNTPYVSKMRKRNLERIQIQAIAARS